jgi:hypothetical protein
MVQAMIDFQRAQLLGQCIAFYFQKCQLHVPAIVTAAILSRELEKHGIQEAKIPQGYVVHHANPTVGTRTYWVMLRGRRIFSSHVHV